MIFGNSKAGTAAQPKFETYLQPMGHCLRLISNCAALSLRPRAQTGLESQLSHHSPITRKMTQNNTYQLWYGDDIDTTLDLSEALF
jgi:hypothetical protein